MVLFLLAVVVSVGYTYYKTIVLQDFEVIEEVASE